MDSEIRPGLISELVVRGDTRGIARAISLVEEETPEGVALLRTLHPHTGRAFLLGVTGPPGAGKSTLVDRLVTLVRRRDLTVGVIAIDPSSPFTGGAILGDRVRMSGQAGDSGVFIRSMATRGHLGGIARATDDAIAVLDAAGRDLVIIETVGVGQDEVAVAGTADVSIVVLVPGTGDDVQAIKAGIMEIADIFVVNKADLPGADRAVDAVQSALSLHPFAAGDWRPPVVRTEATTGTGIEALWAAIEQFRAHSSERQDTRRRTRDRARLRDLVAHRLMQRVERALPAGALDEAAERISARAVDPYTAAEELVDRVWQSSPSARTDASAS